MHYRNWKTSILLIVILLSLFINHVSFAGNFEKTYNFQAQYELFSQKLYVSFPSSLYYYYANESHSINGDSEYARFITPQAVEGIAKSIEEVTSDKPYSDEQFADAVLSLVHQIPYNITGAMYPIETIMDNSGDCAALSILAASIMKAGGLDVVLIHYTGINPGHMNIGVYLPNTPAFHTLLMWPTSFNYDNKTYWTAEATAKTDWKVGDQSESLANAQAIIIPLDSCEKMSPGEVSSSLDNSLLNSSLSINLSQVSSMVEQDMRCLLISGSIQPPFAGQNVTIYVSQKGSISNCISALTGNVGNYSSIWNFTAEGTYYITASWSGVSDYSGADSETLTVFVGPESFVEFQTYDYNYIYGNANFASYETRPMIGVKDFISVPLGQNVSFSYDFTMLQTGHSKSNVQTTTTTIAASEQTIRLPNRQTKTIQIPERTIITPIDVPNNLAPLRLPDDFNQTINSQFCFILQNNQENDYSLNAKGLNNYDVSNIIQDGESQPAVINATESIKENTWYKLIATISENKISAFLLNSDGAPLESMSATPQNATNTNQMVLLVTNNRDNAIILKDFTLHSINSTDQLQSTKKIVNTDNNSGLVIPASAIPIILVLTFAVATVFVKKIKESRDNKRKNVH